MSVDSNVYQNILDETKPEPTNVGNECNENQQLRRIARTPVTTEIRKRIVGLALEGNGCTTISRILSLSRTTVSSIVSKFYSTGEAEAKTRGGDRRGKLTIDQENILCSWVDQNCLLTLKDIKKRLVDEFGSIVSVSTVDRCSKSFHYTIKNVLPVPVPRNTERTIEA
jgi:transposase